MTRAQIIELLTGSQIEQDATSNSVKGNNGMKLVGIDGNQITFSMSTVDAETVAEALDRIARIDAEQDGLNVELMALQRFFNGAWQMADAMQMTAEHDELLAIA